MNENEQPSREELARQLRVLRRQAELDLELAYRVQQRLIAGSQAGERLAVAVRHVPFGGISGDCVGISQDDPVNWDVSVFDVSGHGVAAAILATAVSLEFRRLLADRLAPAEVLEHLDALLCREFGDTGLFITAGVCHFYLDERVLRYSGAGHPAAFVVPAGGGPLRRLESRNPLLGVGLGAVKGFAQDEVPVGAGDLAVLYTDGVTEAVAADGEMFGIERLEALLEAARGESADAVADRIVEEIRRFAAGRFADDVAVAVAQVRK
jgi:serine phosphatase RsbU (regulator of sigma subunit)